MKFEAIKHTDVKGNEQYYLKLTNTKGSMHLVSVGHKTFKAVTDLIEDQKPNNSTVGATSEKSAK